MRSVAAGWLVLCAACRFGVPSSGVDGSEDLALPMAADDLAVADAALPPPPDLSVDPCGPALTPPAGVVAARCVIGDPPALDGDLGEWGALEYTLTHENAQAQSASNSWTGTPAVDDADSSAQFSVRWDLSYLYVAIHVTDDIRGVHPSAPNYATYLDDAAELYVDGLHDRTAAYGSDDHHYIVTADGQSQQYDPTSALGPVPAGAFAVKSDAVGNGYAVEYRVPWSILGTSTVANGRTVGFDVQIDDDDDATMQRLARYLIWWNSASGGCGTPAECSSNFGAAELVGR